MQKAKIKVDIDNVLNSLTRSQFELHKERTGIDINYNDCVNYDYSGVGDKLTINALYEMFTDKELWDRLYPLPESQKYLKKMCDEFDVRIVTATDYRNFAWKIDWMKQYFPFVPEQNIFRVHDKEWIYSDYAIDDYQENLKGDGAHRILIDSPWNKNERDDIFDFHRAKDLKEAYEIICKLEESNGGLAI